MAITLIALVTTAAALLLWRLYHAALPKPLPGIPHDPVSARRLLGDIPAALQHHARTAETIAFLVQRCEELQSPVIQVFMRPFQRPWVVLLNAREAQDIMARRGRDFDRAHFFRDMLAVTFPYNQVHMPTDHQWRFNRRLVADAMSPAFLHHVAAPQVHASTLDLIAVWRHKLRLAKGRTIDVMEDLYMCTVDTIWAATFGVNPGTCASQCQHLSRCEAVPLPERPDALLPLPAVTPPAAYRAVQAVAQSSEIPMNSPFGQSHHWFAATFYPQLRWAIRCKNQLVREQVDIAWQKFGMEERPPDEIKSAVDLIIEREATLARKENRRPEPHSKFIHDELGGFLNAGFETTATTLSWGLKFLTVHPAVQGQLRTSLRKAFPRAAQAGTLPTAEEITTTSLPYLDAVIEEMLRCSNVIPANMRTTIADTEILGYLVPRGINVFMPTKGPSFTSAPMPVDEQKRSPSSREFKADTQRWADQNLADFDPARWLTRSSGGDETTFDGRAAPQQMFGAGVRSCFGRKLGYLEMRVICTLLIWSFELLPPPADLADFKAVDRLTHQPQHVRVRLSPVQDI